MSSRFKSFDVYRKLPTDLSEPTISGGIVSLTFSLLMLILFVSEFRTFLTRKSVSEMLIDQNRGGEKLMVNLDILLPNLPCDFTSLDAQDIMGTHNMNVGGKLYKVRIAQDGKVLEEIHYDDGDKNLDLERTRKAFADKEGCQLVGSFEINKVPGNFHISMHAYGDYLQHVMMQSNLQTLDLSHEINHLSFGEATDLMTIRKYYDAGILNPLDGVKKYKPEGLGNNGIVFQYYMNVIPTTYENPKGQELYVHQFIAHGNEIPTGYIPVLYFRYDLSPVTVKHTLYKESFFRFLVQICAILGGIFTIAGIIDALVYTSVKKMLKKSEIGKLG